MISEVTEWLALHRAHQGSAAKLNGEYLTAGQPVPDFLTVACEELIARGVLALGRADPLGWQRVCVTHTGQARYAALHGIAVRTGMVTEAHPRLAEG